MDVEIKENNNKIIIFDNQELRLEVNMKYETV